MSLMVLALVLSACSSSPVSPSATLNQYLADWSHDDYRAMAALVSHPPKDFVALNRRVAGDLDLGRAAYQVNAVTSTGSRATASLTSHLTLGSFGPWVVHTRLQLVESAGIWRVAWTPRSIIAQLGPGDTVATTVTWPARAAILGAGGAALTTDAPMVSVGVEGSRVTDASALTAALMQAGATANQVSAALTTAKAHPTWFVPVLQVTQAAYTLLKPIIYPVPGTVFNTFSARTPVTAGLSAHIVGTLGPITAQELKSLGSPYQGTDTIGQTGIEGAYERQLAGQPGGSIAITSASGAAVATVATFNAHPGTPVQTTIDPTVQQAAESALAGVTNPAALVAVQASTGSVLASVSLPGNQAVDNALVGAYPPGSTFKVITAADLIEHGLSPSSPATCPPTITVDGESFHNFEGEAQSSLSLQQAFAASCNTAFIGMSNALANPSFTTTAAQFGIGAKVQLGLDAFGGKVPAPTSDAERAATAIGQAQVLVSPLDLANVAASVDSGSLRSPRLVTGSADDSVPAQSLDPTVVSDLRTMMTAVVDSPSGTAANAGLPPGTLGKTGTAEFGTANPPQTDAWFIGYRGDLAFAVLVVGGGVGGAVAAPIAAKFLQAAGVIP
ncbi:MAG TPA: penicillin-binding transpeptidase domain-containing protein [Acidimicrobiales bacterium]|jgi:cell division protein FtsI/penicillin-binding protein 2|nr:penicillin-binding transpeptidase domain-containing protein [Acidimicrobiales bacterium]